MTDLFADMKACWEQLRLQHCERVLPRSVWPYLTGAGLLGYARVSADKNDRWDFDEAGHGCLAVAVHSQETLVDIVAFRPDTPTQWLVRTGNGDFLGEDMLIEAERAWPGDDIPLIVPTPLEWLLTRGRSICMIDMTPAALNRLRDLPAFEVPSQRFAQALRLAMAKPPRMPEINITKAKRDAA